MGMETPAKYDGKRKMCEKERHTSEDKKNVRGKLTYTSFSFGILFQ